MREISTYFLLLISANFFFVLISSETFFFYNLYSSSAVQAQFQPMPAAVVGVTGQVSHHTEGFTLLSSKSLHFCSAGEGQDMTC